MGTHTNTLPLISHKNSPFWCGFLPRARALRRSWAQLIKRVYEVDPLVCPACGGKMRIIAFIIDHDVVDAILRHLAKAEARSPRGPPSAPPLPAAS